MAIAILDVSVLKYNLYFSGCKNFDPQIHCDSEGRIKDSVFNFWFSKYESKIRSIQSAIEEHSQEKCNFVCVYDSPPPYWRSSVFSFQQSLLDEPLRFKSRNGLKSTAYKGGRISKSEYTSFLDFASDIQAKFHFKDLELRASNAEADDLAGLLVNTAPEDQKIYLVTVDKDWKLLCKGDTFWVNLHYKNFLQIINEEQALEDFKAEYVGIQTLADVPFAKSFKGERSDNLPKGFDPRLADLVNFSCPEVADFADCGVEFEWDFREIKQRVVGFWTDHLKGGQLL